MDNSAITMGTVIIGEINNTSSKILNWAQGINKSDIEAGEPFLKELLLEFAFNITPTDQNNYTDYQAKVLELEKKISDLTETIADLNKNLLEK